LHSDVVVSAGSEIVILLMTHRSDLSPRRAGTLKGRL
jgi:hypothetical protein